jgi:hypothetical protein
MVAFGVSPSLTKNPRKKMTILLANETSVAGDGVTDDMAALSALFQQASLNGDEIIAKRGATYRIASNAGIPNRGLVLQNAKLCVNGAAFDFECDGLSYAMRLGSNAKIEGEGSIRTTKSTNVPAFPTSTWHAPVSAGYAYLDPDKGTITAPGTLSTIRGVFVKGVTLGTVRTNNSSVFAIIGDVADGEIADINFDPSATTTLALGFDWSSMAAAGALYSDSSGDYLPMATLASNFNSGALYTVHPHNFDIRRLCIGAMTLPTVSGSGGMGVRLSGCRDMVIDQVDVVEAGFAGFFNTAGDLGWEFAPLTEKTRAAKGIRVSNVRVAKADWYGAYIDWYADNVARAVGYSPMISTVLHSDTIIQGFQTYGPQSGNPGTPILPATDGIFIQYAAGVRIRDSYARGHLHGINIAGGCDRVRVQDCEVIFSQLDGIVAGDSTSPPQDCLIEGCSAFANGVNSVETNPSGIYDVQSNRTQIIRNITGVVGESRQLFGIRTGMSTLAATVVGNYCRGVKSGGVGCWIGGTDVPGTCAVYRDNLAASGTTPYGGATSMPPSYIPA